MMTSSEDPRLAVISTARRMNAMGINVNKSGNVSVRGQLGIVEGFWITPTGIDYEELVPEDIVFIAFNPDQAGQIHNLRLPSSEWLMHKKVYQRRPDVAALVHTHSAHATAMACQDRSIPAFHYMVAAAGGDRIECAPYALFGSEELADVAARALSERNACLLSHHGVLAAGSNLSKAHHGVLAAGSNLSKALKLAREVENLAQMYILTCQLGEPKVLTQVQMQEVLARFKHYGQQK